MRQIEKKYLQGNRARLPETVSHTTLFVREILEKSGQEEAYVFDPALLVYLLPTKQEEAEEEKSPEEERVRDYILREKETVKLVTREEKTRDFFTNIIRENTLPGAVEMLREKSRTEQLNIQLQLLLREYKELEEKQQAFFEDREIFPISQEQQKTYQVWQVFRKELAVLEQWVENWKQEKTASIKEEHLRRKLEAQVEKLFVCRRVLEEQKEKQLDERILKVLEEQTGQPEKTAQEETTQLKMRMLHGEELLQQIRREVMVSEEASEKERIKELWTAENRIKENQIKEIQIKENQIEEGIRESIQKLTQEERTELKRELLHVKSVRQELPQEQVKEMESRIDARLLKILEESIKQAETEQQRTASEEGRALEPAQPQEQREIQKEPIATLTVEGVIKELLTAEDRLKELWTEEVRLKELLTEEERIKELWTAENRLKEIKTKENEIKENEIKESKTEENRTEEIQIKENEITENERKEIKIKEIQIKEIQIQENRIEEGIRESIQKLTQEERTELKRELLHVKSVRQELPKEQVKELESRTTARLLKILEESIRQEELEQPEQLKTASKEVSGEERRTLELAQPQEQREIQTEPIAKRKVEGVIKELLTAENRLKELLTEEERIKELLIEEKRIKEVLTGENQIKKIQTEENRIAESKTEEIQIKENEIIKNEIKENQIKEIQTKENRIEEGIRESIQKLTQEERTELKRELLHVKSVRQELNGEQTLHGQLEAEKTESQKAEEGQAREQIKEQEVRIDARLLKLLEEPIKQTEPEETVQTKRNLLHGKELLQQIRREVMMLEETAEKEGMTFRQAQPQEQSRIQSEQIKLIKQTESRIEERIRTEENRIKKIQIEERVLKLLQRTEASPNGQDSYAKPEETAWETIQDAEQRISGQEESVSWQQVAERPEIRELLENREIQIPKKQTEKEALRQEQAVKLNYYQNHFEKTEQLRTEQQEQLQKLMERTALHEEQIVRMENQHQELNARLQKQEERQQESDTEEQMLNRFQEQLRMEKMRRGLI